jgi:hypothetical protein
VTRIILLLVLAVALLAPAAGAAPPRADDENGGGQPRCDHSISYVNLGGWTYLRVQHYNCSVDYYGPL